MCAVCNILRVNQSEYLSFNVNLAFSKLATTTKISQKPCGMSWGKERNWDI